MANTLTVGSKIQIEKGCRASGIDKGTTAEVLVVRELGADYSHSVAVTFRMLNGYKSGKSFTRYARHVNRLSDTFINMNDGNPLHKITVRVK